MKVKKKLQAGVTNPLRTAVEKGPPISATLGVEPAQIDATPTAGMGQGAGDLCVPWVAGCGRPGAGAVMGSADGRPPEPRAAAPGRAV